MKLKNELKCDNCLFCDFKNKSKKRCSHSCGENRRIPSRIKRSPRWCPFKGGIP